MIRLSTRFSRLDAGSCRGNGARTERWLVNLLACAALGSVLSVARVGSAQQPPSATPVDVELKETPPPHRTLTIDWNPLALFIDRFSLDAVIAPGDHHALVVTGFDTWASTAEFATSLDAQGNQLGYTLSVPSQSFKGFGGELGYRYYGGRGGARGFFGGPSFLIESITATPYRGSDTSFMGYGVAGDVGYEALVADTVAVTIGAGLQYTFTSKSIPPQQLPASIVANERLYPRLLLSFGYAL
jgi:hypothetical protein